MTARNPFETQEVKSRRGGPVKAPLSRETIVKQALELLTKHGPDGLSLRRVAAALDTGPSSLYAYVDDIDELEALVLDSALARVKTRSNRAHWKTSLLDILESYFGVLMGGRGLAQLAMTTVAAGPNGLRVIEEIMALLQAGGLDVPTAAWAVDLVTLFVTAVAAEQSNRGERSDPMRPIMRVIDSISKEDYPCIHGAREFLFAGGRDRFRWALDVLVVGVAGGPRAQPLAEKRRRARRDQKGSAHGVR